MKFESLKLSYGYPFQLQTMNAAGMPERYSCRLIGCLPGRSVLMTVPKKAGHLLRFRSGQKVVLRFMVDNGVGVFVANVEIQTSDPYPIIHLTYPEKVTFKGIRNAVRVKIAISGSIATSGEQQAHECVIHDISETGCRLEASLDLGEIGDLVELTLPVDIQGIARDLLIGSVLRSRVESIPEDGGPAKALYGLEFTQLNDDMRLALLAFVYGEIVQQEISII